MLNETLKVEQVEAPKYEPIPVGIYQVELLDITSKSQETYDSRNGKTREREYEEILSFQWVILSGELRGRSMWNNFIPASLYISQKTGKNKLYKIVEGILGRALTQAEIMSMNGKFLNDLITSQVQVVTENTTKGDKTYSNPVNWIKATALLSPLTAEERENSRVKTKEEKELKKEISLEEIPF